MDERDNVSYPDAALDKDGNICITYDRERGAFCKDFESIMNSAREILTARITEDDIINGSIINKGSYLKRVAYKLTDYDGEQYNLFN